MTYFKPKKAVFGITTALILSACTLPVMAAPVNDNVMSNASVVSTDSTFLGGLDLEAQIITTVEQDQRSPYAKKGIAIADEYLEIHTSPSEESEVVGKLYTGSGCDIKDINSGWSHIVSGEFEGYVRSKELLTGTDAEIYAQENNISELVAKVQSNDTYLYEETSAESKILATVLQNQEMSVVGTENDGPWIQVELADHTGYISKDAVTMDVKYTTAVAVDAEQDLAEEVQETDVETEESETETPAQTTEVSIQDVNETVWGAYSVSIRSSASVDAERLGVLVGGDSITRTGILSNGWSRVDYNGTAAYIKSEYLTMVEYVQETESPAPEATPVEEKVYATAGVNVRSSASTDASIVGTLTIGEGVTRTANNNGWSKVSYNGQTGYVKSDYLSATQPVIQEQKPASSNTSSGPSVTEVNETVYATTGVNIRSSASADAAKLSSLSTGASITRTGKLSNGWSRVQFNGQTGYIKSDYLTTEKPAQPAPSTPSSSSSSNSSLGQQIADFALQYVGNPYVYGGNDLNTGVDCSGFTQQVYLHFGYSIPRRASIQATEGTSVAISDLQPGDLVFYGDSTGVGHVVIYIGNGQVVHASTPTKGIIISDLYYRSPMSAKRII